MLPVTGSRGSGLGGAGLVIRICSGYPGCITTPGTGEMRDVGEAPLEPDGVTNIRRINAEGFIIQLN